MSNDSIWKSNSCKFCFVLLFDMASLTGEKRKIQSRTIVEKYKILKEIEKGESCAAVSCKHSIPKQTLSGWMKEKSKIYDAVEKNATSTRRQRMRGAKSSYIFTIYRNWGSRSNGYEDILCF